MSRDGLTLSMAAILLVVAVYLPASAGACAPPPGFANIRIIDNGSIRTTIATDQAYHALGEPVQLYLSWTNLGSTTVQYVSGVSPLERLSIIRHPCLDESTPECWDTVPYHFPSSVSFFGTTITLAPGACHEWTRTWNGLNSWDESTPTAGLYRITGGLFDFGLNTIVEPPGGAELFIGIGQTSGIPDPLTIVTTWGRVKSFR